MARFDQRKPLASLEFRALAHSACEEEEALQVATGTCAPQILEEINVEVRATVWTGWRHVLPVYVQA